MADPEACRRLKDAVERLCGNPSSGGSNRSVTIETDIYWFELSGERWQDAGLSLRLPEAWTVDVFNIDEPWLHFLVSIDDEEAMRLEVLMQGETTVLWHLDVPFAHRGEGLGAFGFDIYRAYTLFRAGPARGHVGGGDETVAFLGRMGIGDQDVILVDNEAVWEVDASELLEHPGGTIELGS